MQALGDLFDGEGGFAAEARGDGEFGGVAFEAESEVGLGPVQAAQFLNDDARGFGFGAFALEFAGAVP